MVRSYTEDGRVYFWGTFITALPTHAEVKIIFVYLSHCPNFLLAQKT